MIIDTKYEIGDKVNLLEPFSGTGVIIGFRYDAIPGCDLQLSYVIDQGGRGRISLHQSSVSRVVPPLTRNEACLFFRKHHSVTISLDESIRALYETLKENGFAE